MDIVNRLNTNSHASILLSLVSIVIFMLLLMPAAACSAPHPAEPEPSVTESQETMASQSPTKLAESSDKKAFIWQISSDTSTIYLMGSIHVASSAIYPLDEVIENAFQIADSLVVEIDISNINPLLTAELMMK